MNGNGNGKNGFFGKNGNGDLKISIKQVQSALEIVLLSLAAIVDMERTSIKVVFAVPVNMILSAVKQKLNPGQMKKLRTVLEETIASTSMNCITGVTFLNLSEQAPTFLTRTFSQVFLSTVYRNADQIMKNHALYGDMLLKKVMLGPASITNLTGCIIMASISAVMKQKALETGDDTYTKVMGNLINIAIGTMTRLASMYTQTESFKNNLARTWFSANKFAVDAFVFTSPLSRL